MQKYFNNATDRNGNALGGATVFVYDDTGALASLYSDDGATTQANPFAADNDGEYSFYAANGVYSLTVARAGFTTQEVTGILLQDVDDAVIDQAATNLIFTQSGAKIQRLNDRLFVGGATASDGAYPNVEKDWLSDFQVSAGLANGTVLNTQSVILNSDSADANVGFISGSRSLNFTNAASSCIGGMDVAVNNNAALATKAWGRYIEAHRTSATAADTYGLEIDTRTLTASVTPHPWQLGDVIGLQIASGAELNPTGQFDASAAIQIAANSLQFKKGIVFQHDSLDGSTGGVGEACAVAMAVTQNLEWFNSSGVRSGYIKCNTTNVANRTGLIFNNSGAFIVGNNEQALMFVANTASAVNYPQLVASATGGPIQYLAQGTDTNIDVWLRPKGAGRVMFGTRTASADAPVSGYIEILDSGGNLRKLAVIT
jgi:hypothetical protein